MRRILALGEARGYEPDTAQVRSLFAALSCWFEPIENGVQPAQRAREELIAGGDPANAGYTYYATVYYLLDSAPSLDSCVAEVDGRAGLCPPYRHRADRPVARQLPVAGRCAARRKLRRSRSGEPRRQVRRPPAGAFPYAHVNQAVAAAIFGDPVGLTRHTSATVPLLPAAPGQYPTALACLLRGLALAGQARDSDADERGGLLSELDEVIRWLAARAADAPDNFLHLLRLVEAERAWAAGDFRAAVLAFDAARREAAQRQRPWHQALITERAARFYLAHGVEHAGYDLLAQARQQYLAWGATAKVAQLDWAYPALRPHAEATATAGGSQPGDLPASPGHRHDRNDRPARHLVRLAGAELARPASAGCTPAWSGCSAR